MISAKKFALFALLAGAASARTVLRMFISLI